LQKSGIRSTQFAILVLSQDYPISIGALGKMLVIDGTTLTRSLRLLQKADSWLFPIAPPSGNDFCLSRPAVKTLARAVPAGERRKNGSRHDRNRALDRIEKRIGTVAGVAVDLEKPQKDLPAQVPPL